MKYVPTGCTFLCLCIRMYVCVCEYHHHIRCKMYHSHCRYIFDTKMTMNKKKMCNKQQKASEIFIYINFSPLKKKIK